MLKGDVHNRFAEPFLVALKEGFIQWSLKTVSSTRPDKYIPVLNPTVSKLANNRCCQYMLALF